MLGQGILYMKLEMCHYQPTKKSMPELLHISPMNNVITAFSDFPFLLLARDSVWGIICLIAILMFHGSTINHLYMRFERLTRSNIKLTQYNRVFFHFYATFVFLALIHLSEILLWAIFMVGLEIMKTPLAAILFAGSCYTTVGFIEDILPEGWRSLAFFISFTGLFSIAWTTSVMIGMTNSYKIAWRKKYGKPLD